MLIKGGRVLLGKRFVGCDIRLSKTIDEVGNIDGKADIDAGDCYVIPGLVDIHTHGAIGMDFSDANDDIQPLLDYYAHSGVTSVLATTMTLPVDDLARAVEAIARFKRRGGAKCEGIHLEGPFLSYAKRGAHKAENIIAPDFEIFSRLNEGHYVKMITIAPETEGAMEFIKRASEVCTVSIGHTEADYDTACKAFDNGASHVTHLFNAMPPLHHRMPGVIGAALDKGVSVELICDGLHIHPSVIRATFGLFGDKTDLISDSLRCAHMPDGSYELGGQTFVMRGGRATLLDGTIAGSAISLFEGVKNAVKFGVPLQDAVYAASTAPATAAKLKVGKICVGYPADIVVIDRNLDIVKVIIDGEPQL